MPVQGTIIQDDPRLKDPLVREIAELRDQVDRLFREQKQALGGFLAGFDVESGPFDRPAPARAKVSAPVAEVEAAPAQPSPPPARARRPAQVGSNERIDAPSPTPPRPVATFAATTATATATATVASESASTARAEDPRERLDALAKHLDRKLRQAASQPGE